jgi:hypothetical protein
MSDNDGRQGFEITVPVRWKDKKPTHWLTANLKETKRKAQALTFKFHLWPNMREQGLIDFRYDQLSGGIESTLDLQRGLAGMQQVVREELIQKIWPPTEHPDGPPEPANEEEARVQDERIQELWSDHTSKAMDALARMSMLAARLETAAGWRILIVDPPEGWEDIAEKDMPPMRREAVLNAYMRARDEAQEAAGK